VGGRGWRLVAAVAAVLVVALLFARGTARARGAGGEREDTADAANRAMLAREAKTAPDQARAAAAVQPLGDGNLTKSGKRQNRGGETRRWTHR